VFLLLLVLRLIELAAVALLLFEGWEDEVPGFANQPNE
jgi:hypothetical protein